MKSSKQKLSFEELAWLADYDVIIGVDEVGRGALAGPLYASAVAIKREDYENWLVYGPVIRDSKKMTSHAREEGCLWISGQSLIIETAWVNPQEIDSHGISWANTDAMQRAVDGCRAHIDPKCRVKIVSDHVVLSTLDAFESFPRAESRSFAVACASVWAKEQRDSYMKKLTISLPDYGWETHVGYGTLKHREAIMKYGPTPEHRMSFIKNYLD